MARGGVVYSFINDTSVHVSFMYHLAAGSSTQWSCVVVCNYSGISITPCV